MIIREQSSIYAVHRKGSRVECTKCICWLLLITLYNALIHCSPISTSSSSGSGLQSWSEWTLWSTCTKKANCNSGTRERKRVCRSLDTDTENLTETPCLGSYGEQEDCPKENCTNPKPMVFSDVTEAPLSSFISQECDTDAKFAVAGLHGHLIPQATFHYCKSHLSNLFEGYFNIKKLPSNRRSKLGNMTKICFEPRGLTVADVTKMARFNRVVRATLHPEGLKMHYTETVTGIAVVLGDAKNNLQALYFAVPSKLLGYKKVGYRRWRGIGVLDVL